MDITSETLHKKLKDFFGFDTFKGNQEAIIRNLVSGILLGRREESAEAADAPFRVAISGTPGDGWTGIYSDLYLTILSTLIAALILYAHRQNIVRLIRGTENQFRFHVDAPKEE